VYTLVLVDDEVELREGLKNYFPWKELGFDPVVAFPNGLLAIDYIRLHDVSVLLSDIKMPLMDGLTLIERAKALRPQLITVILSGYQDFEYAKKGISLGVREFIVKPTKYEELKQVFSRIADQLAEGKGDQASIFDVDDDQNGVAQSVKRYIEGHLAQASLEQAADYIHLNQYYVSTIFHQTTGERFSDYLTRMRMQKAAELLAETSLNIQDIGLQVGYSNPSSFARSFKQFFALSPKGYRTNREGCNAYNRV